MCGGSLQALFDTQPQTVPPCLALRKLTVGWHELL